MSREGPIAEQLPLAQVVRQRVRSLLERLGSHRAPDLYRRVLGEVERVLIEEALESANGSRGEAAKILGIHRNTLRLRMRALHLAARRK